MADIVNIGEKEAEQIKQVLESNDLPAALSELQHRIKDTDNIELNIAVTGESGSGKSTFINAFRQMGDEEEGAAATGVVETTTVPQAYLHPKYPNVKLWDLPGIGTPNFKAAEYLKTVHFDRYDFFFIVGSDRFKENHVNLAREIKKMEKKFYFLRTKIDHNLADEEKSKPSTFNKEKTLKKIRENCIKEFQNAKIKVDDVFLISSFDLSLFDFDRLHETLESELSEHKRDTLILALPNISLEINKKKKASLKKRIWAVALASAGVAALPIPGLSFATDVAILKSTIKKMCTVFCLDDLALQQIAARSNVSVNELKAEIKSPLSVKVDFEMVVTRLMRTVAVESVVEFFLGRIPLLGPVLAGGMSFTTIYLMLTRCLNELAEDAQNVLMKAVKSGTSVD